MTVAELIAELGKFAGEHQVLIPSGQGDEGYETVTSVEMNDDIPPPAVLLT